MNTARWRAVCLIVCGVCGLGGCVKIDGGAAELSWSLRDQGGDSIETCGEANIQAIQLCWNPVADGGDDAVRCQPPNIQRFMCGDFTGVTGFEIEPGETSLFIEPVCDSGDPPTFGSYEVPPPIVRSVEEGRIVTLNSLLIVVKRTNCCLGPDDMSCQLCTCF